MPPDKRRPRPGGNGRGPLKIIAAGSGDGSDHNLDIPVSQLRHRPIGPGELASLRSIFWRQAGAGHALPAEPGVIVIRGGAT